MGTSAAERRAFVLRRLHSLSGVVPLGVFLGEHLWTNATALGGQRPFDEAVGRLQRTPGLLAFEIFAIFLPLAFHAGYGLRIAVAGRPNGLRYPYGANWRYLLQRFSGVAALVFIVVHLAELRVPKAAGRLRPEDFYPTLEAHLSSTTGGVPWVALGYAVGLVATVFHFANGLWSFTVTWGLVASRRAQARAGWAALAVGLVLFALGLQTLVFFATGSRAFSPGTEHPAAEPGVIAGERPCPTPSPPGGFSP